MGLTLAEAERLNIAHLHPDHPGNRQPSEPARKQSKYRNMITTYNGVKYASKAEAVRAERLDWLKSAGLIKEWRRQPKYALGVPENIYIADFEVIGHNGEKWSEDVKGVDTPKFRRDRKLWARYGPHPLRVLRRGKTDEVITPGGATR